MSAMQLLALLMALWLRSDAKIVTLEIQGIVKRKRQEAHRRENWTSHPPLSNVVVHADIAKRAAGMGHSASQRLLLPQRAQWKGWVPSPVAHLNLMMPCKGSC